MTARSIQIPGGWLVRCDPCGLERHAPTIRPADRLASEHNKKKHPPKENS